MTPPTHFIRKCTFIFTNICTIFQSWMFISSVVHQIEFRTETFLTVITLNYPLFIATGMLYRGMFQQLLFTVTLKWTIKAVELNYSFVVFIIHVIVKFLFSFKGLLTNSTRNSVVNMFIFVSFITI